MENKAEKNEASERQNQTSNNKEEINDHQVGSSNVESQKRCSGPVKLPLASGLLKYKFMLCHYNSKKWMMGLENNLGNGYYFILLLVCYKNCQLFMINVAVNLLLLYL